MKSRSSVKKIQNSWAFYDWANSVYSLTITSAVFPAYYETVTSDRLDILGLSLSNTAVYSYVLSLAFLVIAFISPFLSGLADYTGRKKTFMHAFVLLGSVGCASLFFFTGENTVIIGLGGLWIATIGFAGSLVYYNAFLPEIARPHEFDKLSAKGFSLGYIGSVLLLIINLAMIMKPGWFFIPADMSTLPSQISFLMVGVWWYGFAQVTFRNLPETYRSRQEKGILMKGFRELKRVWVELQQLPRLKVYLAAFFFFSMGVQTVMYMATLFGKKELKLETSQLILTILIIQLVAIAGAYFFAWLSKKLGNFSALQIALLVWIGICIAAYFIYSFESFVALAFVVGSVMGGIQSLARSTYSKLLPETKDHASFFSFYEFCEKIAIVLGTLSYGLIEDLTGSMRNSVMALLIFFLVGIVLLVMLRRIHFRNNMMSV